MARRGGSGVVAGLALALAACSSVDNGATRINGYVMPTATLTSAEPVRIVVSLLDVSKQDVAAEVLGQSSIVRLAHWPIAYSLAYDRGQLKSHHTYAVQARVMDNDGALIAITDTRHQFFSNSDPNNFDLLVRNLAHPGQQRGAISAECGIGGFQITFFDGFMVLSHPENQDRRVFLQVEAASGSKYQRESEIMWFKGDEATFTDTTDKFSCIISAYES